MDIKKTKFRRGGNDVVDCF